MGERSLFARATILGLGYIGGAALLGIVKERVSEMPGLEKRECEK